MSEESQNRVDVTIDDHTKVNLGWVVAVIGATATSVIACVMWITDVKAVASSAFTTANKNEATINAMKTDISDIRSSQSRVEGWISAQPSLKKDGK